MKHNKTDMQSKFSLCCHSLSNLLKKKKSSSIINWNEEWKLNNDASWNFWGSGDARDEEKKPEMKTAEDKFNTTMMGGELEEIKEHSDLFKWRCNGNVFFWISQAFWQARISPRNTETFYNTQNIECRFCIERNLI